MGLVFLSGCVRSSHEEDTRLAVVEHFQEAYTNLEPYFKRAHLNYPPREVSFLIFKNTGSLQLWARDSARWQYVRTYSVLAHSGKAGPKLRNGDKQIPEGTYNIVSLNPHSRFDLSMQLNYPNLIDRYYASRDGRYDLGDNIFIHGSHYSIGCIAVGDSAIHDLFVLSYLVGIEHIKVIIAPTDLRRYVASRSSRQPIWVPKLYSQIKKDLSVYF